VGGGGGVGDVASEVAIADNMIAEALRCVYARRGECSSWALLP